MSDSTKRDDAKEIFDWKGKAGEEFALWNPTTVEGVDKVSMEFFGTKVSDVLRRVMDALEKDGMDKKDAKVLDVGCSSGGKLAVFELLGIKPDHLYGVDLSPKAIELLKKDHPEYHAQVIDGYVYEVGVQPDLLHHSGVLCQIPQEDYDQFFGKIKSLNPKYYIASEGINPRGYEKIPNSHAHGHHHEHHHHGHEEGHHDKHVPMEEGHHHTNDMKKVVDEYFPNATEVYSEKLNFAPENEHWFKAMHMDYSLVRVLRLRN